MFFPISFRPPRGMIFSFSAINIKYSFAFARYHTAAGRENGRSKTKAVRPRAGPASPERSGVSPSRYCGWCGRGRPLLYVIAGIHSAKQPKKCAYFSALFTKYSTLSIICTPPTCRHAPTGRASRRNLTCFPQSAYCPPGNFVL